jgi:hypothetical protein
MKTIFLFLLAIGFCGCATTNFADQEKITMNSWMGHTKAELIQSWGPPKSISTDGKDGEVYTYETSVNFSQSPGQVYTQYNNVYYTNPQNNVVTRSRMFYINKSGAIYSWLCKGRQGY